MEQQAGPGSRRLGIIAGSGFLPLYVAQAARANGENPFIIALKDEVDRDWGDFQHVSAGIGDFAAIRTIFAEHSIDRVVLSGAVQRRPHWKDIRPTLRTLRKIPSVLATLLAGGDDSVLKMAIELIEASGARVIGVHEIVPELLAEIGPLGAHQPNTFDENDIRVAASAADAIGKLDIGQGAVAVGGRVVALEGPEGTDAMLQRVAELKASGRIPAHRKGVLVKLCKTNQDMRADLPSIGPSTIAGAEAAGLAGIAVEAGRALVLERETTMAAANADNVFLTGIERGKL